MKDVARRVGVSISTVSRVVNDGAAGSVSPETSRKIWDAVAELGYRPVRRARQSAKDGRNASSAATRVGCVVAATQNKYNHPYFSEILEGIEKELVDSGYEIAYVLTGDELRNPAALHRILRENVADGLILVEGLESSLYETLRKNVPRLVGVDVSNPGIPRVTYDRVEAARAAVRHLLGQGHTRIAFIGGAGLSQDVEKEKRCRGYRLALREAGIDVPSEWILNAQWDVEKSYQLTKRLLQSGGERPTAFFAASDMMAISAMRAANECGLRIPDDVAFVGIDGIEMSAYSSPPLTTVHIPKFEIGSIAAKTLIDYIRGKYQIPVKISVPFELKIRRSSLAWKSGEKGGAEGADHSSDSGLSPDSLIR